jgi:hypothetical protein
MNNDICKLNKLKKSFVFRTETSTHTNTDNRLGCLKCWGDGVAQPGTIVS